MTATELKTLRKTDQNALDPQVVDFSDGLFRIEQSEPLYGPRGGYLGERSIYWPDAYPTRQAAERAIRVVRHGGCNPQTSIRVSMDTGECV